MAQSVLERIYEEKIIAIVRGIPSGKIAALAQALAEGGVSCIEVTFDQTNPEETLTSLRTIKSELGDRICLGAGTVMTVEQVEQAAQAGAEYMISPNVDEAVIRATKALGKVSIPGAMTPTETAFAYQCGADIVKLFPAGLLGPAYIKAVKAPLKHIPVSAVGNITIENCADFIQAGAVGVGVGGNLVSALLVNEGCFSQITATARAYREKLK
ncbi:MAG: bifunctional 4-hydroxy-2-oxoglutarate aldolase/2-dehydro-3-deoxy-phosphogluconate aldolase [Lawsonibacter sp.]|jgi:2-dehydro-3-deoxyphosphogluconate aldolase/(4S)-4-hydroxy-2-oxoglutarate aldolase|uniref:bifunctional 4-hydroxy-2-oxoglutarate aldolase/2-dehydro-3-deoxy-phosphogluconate aldolase n=1 Tax=Lawsonibacter sp. JLR.KK007 TaxID=3114293 RepID=UPI002170116F|nr:bifunctional 4-hydroxy-2-oxoglutarate aldolase/2-dehydro-3-deoxy-phosphogluconate aldolase [Lawsonibacter sp.]